MKVFYTLALWMTRLELAIAKAQKVRNYDHIAALQRDEDDYERALSRLTLNL